MSRLAPPHRAEADASPVVAEPGVLQFVSRLSGAGLKETRQEAGFYRLEAGSSAPEKARG